MNEGNCLICHARSRRPGLRTCSPRCHRELVRRIGPNGDEKFRRLISQRLRLASWRKALAAALPPEHPIHDPTRVFTGPQLQAIEDESWDLIEEAYG